LLPCSCCTSALPCCGRQTSRQCLTHWACSLSRWLASRGCWRQHLWNTQKRQQALASATRSCTLTARIKPAVQRCIVALFAISAQLADPLPLLVALEYKQQAQQASRQTCN
jgi:hypothetical protein